MTNTGRALLFHRPGFVSGVGCFSLLRCPPWLQMNVTIPTVVTEPNDRLPVLTAGPSGLISQEVLP